MKFTKYDFLTANGKEIPKDWEVPSSALTASIIEEYNNGEEVRGLYHKYKIPSTTIRKILTDAGIRIRISGRTGTKKKLVDEKLISELYVSGRPLLEIQKRFGIAYERATEILIANDVQIRTPKEGRAMKARLNAESK